MVFYSKPIEVESLRMIHEEPRYDERVTVNETIEPNNQEGHFHIEEIDFKDNVMVDNNPRKRKRMERDINRSNMDF
jgi:hypothetical protein